ncbi:hypothetical protein FSP39_022159 [Pinctada imbricata]|uniref:C-type lectin domain-containing protein n=1 Tax=Pinctada imbricata TaxID=66713 RepID=A0AA89C2S8_PINIB|nr:hypothetical protein FSP39_022159 [Pinctada imbricata]
MGRSNCSDCAIERGPYHLCLYVPGQRLSDEFKPLVWVQASFLILTDTKHNKYWKAQDACADQYGGELVFVSELSADQYLSVLDCLPYYQRFWIQRETSNNLEYNVCRKPYSFATSSFVNLECRLITGDAGTTYPCLCRTDQRPSDNDYGTICWRSTITTSPTTSTSSTTSSQTREVTTPEVHTTTSPQTNDSVIQSELNHKKEQNGGKIAGAVLGVIFGILVTGSVICLMFIWKKRRDLWDKYWCLKNTEPHVETQNEYDSVDANAASETHVYCGLNRSETGNTFLPTEDAYYSEPNTVNSSPRHSSGLQSPNIDNIHYIVMDNSINRAGNENAYSISVIDHSEQRENEANEDLEQSLDSNMYHRLEPRNNDVQSRPQEQEPFYDLAHNTMSAKEFKNDSNVNSAQQNCSDENHDVMDSNNLYELAQNV